MDANTFVCCLLETLYARMFRVLYPVLMLYMLFYTVPAASTTSTKPKRNAPKCKMCIKPMKGHKNVASCPSNKTN